MRKLYIHIFFYIFIILLILVIFCVMFPIEFFWLKAIFIDFGDFSFLKPRILAYHK